MRRQENARLFVPERIRVRLQINVRTVMESVDASTSGDMRIDRAVTWINDGFRREVQCDQWAYSPVQKSSWQPMMLRQCKPLPLSHGIGDTKLRERSRNVRRISFSWSLRLSSVSSSFLKRSTRPTDGISLCFSASGTPRYATWPQPNSCPVHLLINSSNDLISIISTN